MPERCWLESAGGESAGGDGVSVSFGACPKRDTNPVPTGTPPGTPSPFYNYLGENRYE